MGLTYYISTLARLNIEKNGVNAKNFIFKISGRPLCNNVIEFGCIFDPLGEMSGYFTRPPLPLP